MMAVTARAYVPGMVPDACSGGSLLYGFDIETDTAAGGLDPRVAGIVAVGLSSEDGEVVFTGSEAGVLIALDDHLAACPPGVIVTWNGSGFDLPFVAHRAWRAGVTLGLVLRPGPPRPHRPRRAPGPGPPLVPTPTYLGSWHHHRHLDAYRAYRGLTDPEVSCALKAVARNAGLNPVEVDTAAIHALPLALLRRYVASDATVTRRLAERRWSEMGPFVDPVIPGTGRGGGPRPPPATQ